MNSPQKIRLLDDHLINQIAAGEVVERPLSIVKELTENALDAGADRVTVEIVEGGLAGVIVTDNGNGIGVADIPLAVQRHCTSKLANAEQLTALHTLGFRGEALASIAAVSSLRLVSRTPDDRHAWQLDCEYGRFEKPKAAPSYPVGTTVRVENLFENTPAKAQVSKTIPHRIFTDLAILETNRVLP